MPPSPCPLKMEQSLPPFYAKTENALLANALNFSTLMEIPNRYQMENRKNHRIIYMHLLNVQFQSEFLRGRILDISNFGLQFFSYAQLNENENYDVRFQIEKEKNLMTPSEIWSREGEIRWTEKHENGYLTGIEFNPELDKIPDVHKENLLADKMYVEQIIDTYDLYQLFIFPKEMKIRF